MKIFGVYLFGLSVFMTTMASYAIAQSTQETIACENYKEMQRVLADAPRISANCAGCTVSTIDPGWIVPRRFRDEQDKLMAEKGRFAWIKIFGWLRLGNMDPPPREANPYLDEYLAMQALNTRSSAENICERVKTDKALLASIQRLHQFVMDARKERQESQAKIFDQAGRASQPSHQSMRRSQ